MKRYFTPAFLGLLFILLILSTVYAPRYAGPLGTGVLILFLTFALAAIIRHRWSAYRRGDVTGGQTFLRIFLDMLGLTLAFSLATLLGKLTADWAAAYGLWAGILAGCAICFVAAMAVMKLWRVFFR